MLKVVISSKRLKKTPILNLVLNEQVVTKTKTNFRIFKSLKTLVTVIVLFFHRVISETFFNWSTRNFLHRKKKQNVCFQLRSKFYANLEPFFRIRFFSGPETIPFFAGANFTDLGLGLGLGSGIGLGFLKCFFIPALNNECVFFCSAHRSKAENRKQE